MKRAFTLLEILMVVMIVTILAGLGMPQYFKTRERALGNEAIANLKLIAAAEKIYRMENNQYYPASDTESNISNINNNLKLSLVENNWHYSITGGASTFTAAADRLGSGGYFECSYTLANNDADGEPNASSPCP